MAAQGKQQVGFISTRICGTDGVSLEIRKWATLFNQLHCENHFCAGELDTDLRGLQVPEMHFQHPEINMSVLKNMLRNCSEISLIL